MTLTSAPAWNLDQTNLEVGHRGVGQSYLEDESCNSDVLENTILSLNTVSIFNSFPSLLFDKN
jgi:hypothetical protein